MEPRLLMKDYERKRIVDLVATDLRASFVALTRVVRDMGWAREVELTGAYDRSRIRLESAAHRNVVNVVACTAKGVKSALRQLRPQEAEKLAAIDREIALCEARLSGLRLLRTKQLLDAWKVGHVVTLARVKTIIDGQKGR